MSASGPVVITLIGVWGAVQVTRATLTYRAARHAADRKAAKETGSAS